MSQFEDASELPRYKQFQDLITTLDLIDQNTYGAMGAQYVFMRQLTGTDALGLTDDAITELLWPVKKSCAEITEWLYGFFNMAYAPLSDADLATYIAFQKSDAGRALNRSLFAGFNELSVRHAQKMGAMVAELLQVRDL